VTEEGPTLFDSFGDEPVESIGVAELETVEGLLALTALSGIGSTRAIRLARTFRTVAAFNQASPEQRKRVAGVVVDGIATLINVDPPDPSVRLMGYFDPQYPAALRDLKDPPAVLWVRGVLRDPARRIAIVGTRSATDWGRSMAETIARDAAQAGITVVSGLAFGIDIAAHRAAMAAGGQTIAILGSGIDKTSPREHRADADEIVATGGCLLTEQPPGTDPGSRTLVARNRLQSGLSAATIVVQCGTGSGTMHAARFALEQGKILAVPRPPEAERVHAENAGSLSLLAATPRPRVLTSRDDVLALLAEI
jgi:DNA processing protein